MAEPPATPEAREIVAFDLWSLVAISVKKRGTLAIFQTLTTGLRRPRGHTDQAVAPGALGDGIGSPIDLFLGRWLSGNTQDSRAIGDTDRVNRLFQRNPWWQQILFQ